MSQTRHLPAARQRQLVSAAQAGDRHARETLVRTNEAFLAQTASSYLGRGLEMEDLMQEATIGMLVAIDKFDLSKPFTFLTYAAHWVRQRLGRACETQGSINRHQTRVPADVLSAMSKISQVRERLGADCDDEHLAETVGHTVDTVRQARRVAARTWVSADASGEDDELVAQVPDPQPSIDEQVMTDDLKDAVARAVDDLPADEARLLRARFGLGGERETGELDLQAQWGASRSRLQSLRASAMRRLAADDRVRAVADSRHGSCAVPRAAQRERDAKRATRRPTCGHLAAGACLDRLAERAVGSVRVGDGALAGRHGSFWWLAMRPAGGGLIEVTVSDGPDGRMLDLPVALSRFRGEQALEAAEFAATLPLNTGSCGCATAVLAAA